MSDLEYVKLSTVPETLYIADIIVPDQYTMKPRYLGTVKDYKEGKFKLGSGLHYLYEKIPAPGCPIGNAEDWRSSELEHSETYEDAREVYEKDADKFIEYVNAAVEKWWDEVSHKYKWAYLPYGDEHPIEFDI